MSDSAAGGEAEAGGPRKKQRLGGDGRHSIQLLTSLAASLVEAAATPTKIAGKVYKENVCVLNLRVCLCGGQKVVVQYPPPTIIC